MLSDKAIRQLRAKVQQLFEIDPLFKMIDTALAERQRLRERNVRYGADLGAANQEVIRLRMVLREHGMVDYLAVEAEPEEAKTARKNRIQNALISQAEDLGDVPSAEGVLNWLWEEKPELTSPLYEEPVFGRCFQCDRVLDATVKVCRECAEEAPPSISPTLAV
jgi:hypothetical protein